MVTPEFYYTLKYAFHFAENITIDFLPIPDHHVKYRQEKFINKITKYFNDKNLNVEKIKSILEENNIRVNNKIRESNMITLKKNELIRAQKNEEFLNLKKIINKYSITDENHYIQSLNTRTEDLNFKELSFLKENALLFVLRNKDIYVFGELFKNRKFKEADFIWNNYHNDWSIESIKKQLLSAIIKDKDLFQYMTENDENYNSIEEVNKIICDLTEKDLKSYCTFSNIVSSEKVNELDELTNIVNKWKVSHEKRNLAEILEKPQSIKKTPSRRL